MTVQAALAAAATLVAAAFALSTFERWLGNRRRHEAAWTISLLLFTVGAAALWAGAAFGWSEWAFRVFFLSGAVLTVPFLALGTVYLVGGRRHGDRWALLVALGAAFAVGIVIASPLTGSIDPDELPRGSEVFPAGPRILAAVASGGGALVVIAGALWTATRLLVRDREAAAEAPSAHRLAAANLLIALGTVVLSLGGLLNSLVGEMNAFAVSLVVGIVLIFAGFLLTNPPRARTGHVDQATRDDEDRSSRHADTDDASAGRRDTPAPAAPRARRSRTVDPLWGRSYGYR